jgi:flagella basal body P-ring formation protein FlgA
MARQFLKQAAPASVVYEAIPLVRPKELALTGEPEDIQLEPQLMSSTARGIVTVQVRVIVGGKDIGSRNIPFRLKYECRRVVTRSDIAEGTVLTSENVKIEKTFSNRPEPVGWKPPYGLVATRALPAKMEIRDDMIHSARSDVIVRRNRTVVIRIERPGFTVTAVGTALQEARTGETLKVRNEDSRRVIVCTVNPDGTVAPVL